MTSQPAPAPRRDRVLLGTWVVLLYAAAAWARPVAEGLRSRGLLSAVVWALSVLAFVFALSLLRPRPGRPASRGPSADRPRPISPLALLATALAAAWLATAWNLPEERIHLAQYGPVGVLAWRVLGGRVVAALALGAVLGLGDELIQGLLPSRTFDPWDVLANGIAASAGVFVARGGRGTWIAPGLLVAARLVLPVVHPGHPGVSGGPGPIAPAGDVFPPGEPQLLPTAQALEPAPYEGASVLFVTIDALRADRVPPWGHAAVPTPALDRLSSESLALEGRANALWTTPSMVSLFTGLNPATHGVAGRGQELAPSVNTPLETLARAGWRVVGHAGQQTETYRHLGIEREIDPELPLEAVALQELSSGRTFLWLHIREVHAPYDASVERLDQLDLPRPPASPVLDRARTHFTVPRRDFPGDHAWLKSALSALYDVEVADADAALGRLLDALDGAGLNPLVVLTADHGEELLERGGIGHASTTLMSQPWPELVEVPLLIRFPDRRRAGERDPGLVQQVDVLPSLLPLLGLEPEVAAPDVPLDGRDLSASWLEGLPRRSVPVLVHSSPCGWQCPPERRGERVSALWDGEWLRCEPSCPPALRSLLDASEARRRRLGTPVASPPRAE